MTNSYCFSRQEKTAHVICGRHLTNAQNVGGVFVRSSRNGGPSRKQCVINGQIPKASNKINTPLPPPALLQTGFRWVWSTAPPLVQAPKTTTGGLATPRTRRHGGLLPPCYPASVVGKRLQRGEKNFPSALVVFLRSEGRRENGGGLLLRGRVRTAVG